MCTHTRLKKSVYLAAAVLLRLNMHASYALLQHSRWYSHNQSHFMTHAQEGSLCIDAS